jgi:hypothetical protein
VCRIQVEHDANSFLATEEEKTAIEAIPTSMEFGKLETKNRLELSSKSTWQYEEFIKKLLICTRGMHLRCN